MKFIHYLEKITGVGIYPLVSLCIFVAFFAVVAAWVAKADNKYIGTMKQLPFSENE